MSDSFNNRDSIIYSSGIKWKFSHLHTCVTSTCAKVETGTAFLSISHSLSLRFVYEWLMGREKQVSGVSLAVDRNLYDAEKNREPRACSINCRWRGRRRFLQFNRFVSVGSAIEKLKSPNRKPTRRLSSNESGFVKLIKRNPIKVSKLFLQLDARARNS